MLEIQLHLNYSSVIQLTYLIPLCKMFNGIFYVHGSVEHSTIHKKIQQDATVYQTFIIPYLYEAQHVSGDTSPIIRSLKLH